jgi:hypothetical protein
MIAQGAARRRDRAFSFRAFGRKQRRVAANLFGPLRVWNGGRMKQGS